MIVTFSAWSEDDAYNYLSRYYPRHEIINLYDTEKKGHPNVRGTLWKAELQVKP